MNGSTTPEREWEEMLAEEREKRADAEARCLQLQMLLEQQEAETLEMHAALAAETARLKAAGERPGPAGKDLPPVWHAMAKSRVGRALCRLFRLYCALRGISVD